MSQVQELAPVRRPVDLDGRYRCDSGPVLMTGVQAIPRLLAEQHQRDHTAGTRLGTFVSGYQGSPLAGLDQLLAGLPELRSDRNVRLVPALNEELAATSVWGSQMELPGARATRDAVLGVWYGKGPGLDRAGDALRHMTMYGVHPEGGALILVGDDPAAKSSSVPAASERSLAALGMPILFPRNAEELITFGLHGVALSRLSGCPVAMKIVADVADGIWTVDRDFAGLDIVVPTVQWEGRPWTYRQRILASPPDSVLAEADLYGPRWEAVEAFNAANDLDTIEVDSTDAWLGIVAVGTAYDAVRSALRDMGVDDAALQRAGVRILRVGMPYPLDAAKVRTLARGVETVLVVEDKVSFVEMQVRQHLYGLADAPQVAGKRAASDASRLIPPDGELTGARLIGPLRKVLARRPDRVTMSAPPRSPLPLLQLTAKRTAYFCSGCPHNRSTAVPDGSLAAGGIGCHTLVTMSGRTDSQVTGLTQMGGEGAQWIGQAPFADVDHIFQNVGDGTYFHSGQLAVQACVAAGVNITYKVLYNSAVAMTGAQRAEGGLSVLQLAHKLMAEGVERIIVCADEPRRHRRSRFPQGVSVWHRDRLDEAQRSLRDVKGVTVLVYDQQCAADARRKRKRGELTPRRTRVMINEAVCEGCGDCGVKSNCLSVQPVDTEFGRKTRIDQESCNTDYSCLDGQCPSFVTVEVDDGVKRPKRTVSDPPPCPTPAARPVEQTYNIFLAGIGGTGIVTVNQVLATAALRSGLHVEGLDQTGLSQKAGPVTSHLRLSPPSSEHSANRINPGFADCVLAFDLLTATEQKNVQLGHPERTVTIASTSRTPTGDMVYDPSVVYPDTAGLLDRARSASRELVAIDAYEAATQLFGNTAVANFLLVGAAYQAGAVPIPGDAIEEAIALNGVAVDANQRAFRWGRAAVASPDVFADAIGNRTAAAKPVLPAGHRLLGAVTIAGATLELTRRRAAELIDYQGEGLAAHYIQVVQRVWDAERAVGASTSFSENVAIGLFKLMAYKDEYEVARLLTEPAFLDAVRTQTPGGRKLTYRLHPPTLKALGRKKKIGMKPGTHFSLRLLRHGKFLRNTPLDPFGHSSLRRLERAILTHYEQTILRAATNLSVATYETATALAEAPDLIRGYEEVKLRTIDTYRARLTELGADTTPIRN